MGIFVCDFCSEYCEHLLARERLPADVVRHANLNAGTGKQVAYTHLMMVSPHCRDVFRCEHCRKGEKARAS